MKKLLALSFLICLGTILAAQSLDTLKIKGPYSKTGLTYDETLFKAFQKVNYAIKFTNAAVYPVFTGKASRATGLQIINIVDYDLNKIRTTWTQATDTSSLSLYYSYTGSPLLTLKDKNGQVLFRADSIGFGFGTATPKTKVSALVNTATNLNAFNFVNSDINKTRTTYATAIDTSSMNLSFTATGSPAFNVTGKTGNALIAVDSASVIVTIGDTTVAKKMGRIVYKTSDSTFYGCRYVRPTGKKCWWPLDH